MKKLCEKDPANWDKYLNQVLNSYRITQNLATAETPFFLAYDRDPNLPLHQLLEPMEHFLGDPDSSMLNLETHRLALAIAKKTLDENRFKTAQKTTARDKPAFQVGDCVYFKNKQSGKWDLNGDPDIKLSTLSVTDTSYILKTKPLEKYDLVMCLMSYWNHP